MIPSARRYLYGFIQVDDLDQEPREWTRALVALGKTLCDTCYCLELQSAELDDSQRSEVTQATLALKKFLRAAEHDRKTVWDAFQPGNPDGLKVYLALTGESGRFHEGTDDLCRDAQMKCEWAELEFLEATLADYIDVHFALIKYERETWNPSARQPVVGRDVELEARDKWMYQQAVEIGMSYNKVLHALKRQPPEWPELGSANAVKKAINAYAKRHRLPPPSPRKAGIPKSKPK
jgi:hypothetical protein